MRKIERHLMVSAALFGLFVVFTVIVKLVGVGAVGPLGTTVGFSTLNNAIFTKLGFKAGWYKLTQCFGYVAILTMLAFAAMGGLELWQTRSIKSVDKRILLLGAFYVIVLIVYIFFEKAVVVNYRPVMFDGELEASYPSSHTILSVCVFGSAALMLPRLLDKGSRMVIAMSYMMAALGGITVIGRFLSGVHWFTDIIGGVLISASLLLMFYTALEITENTKKGKHQR